MTFSSTLKKSGPIAISKNRTGSVSKSSSPGLSGSPVSPLNTSIKKVASGSSVKTSAANKNPEKTGVMTTVEKVPVPLKSPPSSKSVIKSVIDLKSESIKTATSATKVMTKSVTKPSPLKLNLKEINASGLLKSPFTPKSVPKTPTTPSLKKPVTKSPSATNPVLAAKSTLLSGAKSPSSPLSKLNNLLTVSLPTSKSQVTVDTKSSTVQSTSKSLASPVSKSPKVSVASKAPTVSLPVAKTLTLATVTQTTVPKLPLPTTKLSSSTIKSFTSKTDVNKNSMPLKPLVQSKEINVKPTTPVKKTAVLSTKNITGVKLLTTISKPSTTPKSPSLVSTTKSNSPKVPNSPSSIKSISPKVPNSTSSIKSVLSKVPNSPSKLLSKDPKIVKISNNLTLAEKSNVTLKSGPPAISKVIVNKEPNKLSLSIPKTLQIKSTSSVCLKPTTLKTKVTSPTVPKNLVPKLLTKKTQPLTGAIIPSSPTVKTPLPIVKTSLSPAVKIKTLSSPTVGSRITSISAKPPLSPAKPKLLPTKLILSPSKRKLSSSRLNSDSNESLALKTPLKSPMSPKSANLVLKSSSKVIQKPNKAPIAKAIRGRQPVQKTTVIPGINELPTNKIINQSDISDVCKEENIVKNDLQEAIESIVPETLNQSQLFFETFETVKTEVNSDISKTTDTFVYDDVSLNALNAENIEKSVDVQEHNIKTVEQYTVAFSSLATTEEQKQDENLCNLSDFVIVTEDECKAQLSSISQSSDNCNILIVEDHFSASSENVVKEQLDKTQLCNVETEESYEPMNDKLVLGDVPFETDSSQSEISDTEQATLKEAVEVMPSDDEVQKHSEDDVFLFTNTEDLSINDRGRSGSIDNFIHQFMPKSVEQTESASSISTDDGSFVSRKSYSEAVVGSPRDGEFYFDYGSDLADDCLDYDDEISVFVEVTEKEFPELKPNDLSCKRRNKKQKKRNCSSRTESYDSNSSSEEINYNPKDFDGNEFSHYIKMMKDCSFYPNGLFCSDSVKLSSSSSLSWLDISVRTTDDDLVPSTESLSTYEIFQASNLNKDFLMSVIGCTNVMSPSSNESSWSWKSIEGKHQSHVKTNITLSLQPRPKHLTTPRFMLLLALISEAKGYEIQPSLSEHFVTTDCMPRFDNKIRRLMVQGFWMVGRLITESLSDNEETNCGNPFGFADGDRGLWWAGINMLDWQEYLKECVKGQELLNCYQFVIENNIDGKRHYSSEALLSMSVSTPEEFMSECDVENFIHSVRNVKYYCGNCFVDSEENLEEAMNEDSCNDDNDLLEWGNGSIIQQN